MVLTEAQKELVANNIEDIVAINNKKYYIKPLNTNFSTAYMEIVAEKLANILGIPCAHYEVAEITNNKKVYLSEVIGDKDTYIDYNNIQFNIPDSPDAAYTIKRQYSLYTLWHKIESKYPEYSQNIIHDVIKMYLFDFIFLHSDRHTGNWGLLKTDEGIKAVILDNEGLFDAWPNTYVTSKYYSSDDLSQYHNWESLDCSDHDASYLNELEYFLKTSSEEYTELLNEMLDLVPPSVVSQVFMDTENEFNDKIKLKDSYLNLYKNHYQRLEELLGRRSVDGKRIP